MKRSQNQQRPIVQLVGASSIVKRYAPPKKKTENKPNTSLTQTHFSCLVLIISKQIKPATYSFT